MRKGYTLIEILIVIAVLMIILFFSVIAFNTLTKRTDLDTSRDNIISTLNIARNKTLASQEAAQYGVYFDTTTDPDRYIFFQGPSYASRDSSFDEIYDLSSGVEISNFNLNGGDQEVVFKRLKGNTNNHGSVTLRSSISGETRTIYIYSSGEVSTRPESVSERSSRIIDSRHIHLDLGWSIQNSLILTLYFYSDPDVIVNIQMDDYFNADKTEFDWRDTIDVNGENQSLRIHTHHLDSTDTLLCIHRDRRENNKALKILIDDKEIVSYTTDGEVTVGAYGGNMEIQ